MKRALSFLSILLLAGTAFSYPAYNAGSAQSLFPGTVVQVWAVDTPTPGNGTTAASQQVVTQSSQNKAATPFSVDGKFSGAPGAFEVDVQCASSDSDTNYQTISNGNVTTVDSTNQTFHLDAGQATCKFIRLLMRSRTNSVSIVATITGG